MLKHLRCSVSLTDMENYFWISMRHFFHVSVWQNLKYIDSIRCMQHCRESASSYTPSEMAS